MRWRRLGLGALLFCSSLAKHASAELSAAEEQYRRGVAAFEAGDYVVACRAFSESYRLDPLPGALFTLATCEMRAGKLASAAARFAQYLTLVDGLPPEQQQREVERRAVAAAERRKLHAQVPRLKLLLTDASKTTQVLLNGAIVPPQSLGVELPLDPGEQLVEQRFVGGNVHSERVNLKVGESKLVVLKASSDAPSASRKPSAPSADAATPQAPSLVLPVVLGGVGVAGLVVGSVTGGLALGNAAEVRRECEGPACSVAGKAAADAGKRQALISTVAFGVGAVGLTAGTVLFVVRARSTSGSASEQLAVGVSPQQITVSGTF